jgi:hypothetical protein
MIARVAQRERLEVVMTLTVEQPDVRVRRSPLARIVVGLAIGLAIVLVLAGGWLWRRGGTGHLAAGTQMHARHACSYDEVTGRVSAVVSFTGFTTGGSVRAGARMTVIGGGPVNPDDDDILGEVAVTKIVHGPFQLNLPLAVTVNTGLAPDSVVCYFGMLP